MKNQMNWSNSNSSTADLNEAQNRVSEMTVKTFVDGVNVNYDVTFRVLEVFLKTYKTVRFAIGDKCYTFRPEDACLFDTPTLRRTEDDYLDFTSIMYGLQDPDAEFLQIRHGSCYIAERIRQIMGKQRGLGERNIRRLIANLISKGIIVCKNSHKHIYMRRYQDAWAWTQLVLPAWEKSDNDPTNVEAKIMALEKLSRFKTDFWDKLTGRG